MNLIAPFFIFVFGTLIGSFLNVVILRLNTGKKIFGPKERSICLSCGKKLNWYELVPFFSFCFLRARCLGCKSPISWQYPLVEVGTGLLFLAIFAKNFSNGFLWYFASSSEQYFTTLAGFSVEISLILTLLYLVIWSLLVVITVYDLRHKIIPNGLVYAFIVISLAASIFSAFFMTEHFAVPMVSIVDAVFAGIIFFSFFAFLWLVSGGRWLGFGDAKLVLGVGFLLGLVKGFSALALAFWIGAIVSVALMLVARLGRTKTGQKVIRRIGLHQFQPILTIKSEIPFAPFIILGTLIAFFCHIDVLGIGAFF